MESWSEIRALNLEGNGIMTPLDTFSFAVFEHLEFFNIANNFIPLDVTGLVFSPLVNLQYMYASGNRIEGRLLPHALDDMPQLRELDLSNK